MSVKRSIFKPKARGSYRLEAKNDEATVYIYDEIGWFGVGAGQFVKDVNAISAKTIHLRINSPGGSVFDGMAIYNTLKQHKARVITHIDGLAGSISSIIAMAGDEIVAGEGAYLMIHEPWSVVIGSAADLRAEAELLDKIGGTIADIYTQRSGKSREEVLDLMGAETWFTGPEALENGFIDRLEASENAEKARSKAILFDLSAFANVPDALKREAENPIVTERGLEKALRDAGCSRAQAKAILADGLPEDLRDAGTTRAEPDSAIDLRDAGESGQREADEPDCKQERRDRVASLLIRAEQLKSTIGGTKE